MGERKVLIGLNVPWLVVSWSHKIIHEVEKLFLKESGCLVFSLVREFVFLKRKANLHLVRLSAVILADHVKMLLLHFSTAFIHWKWLSWHRCVSRQSSH